MTPPIVVDQSLLTAGYWLPAQAGWAEPNDLRVEHGPLPADLLATPGVALIDSLAASTLLDSHVVVRNHAVVWHAESMLTLVTHARPDELEQVTVSAPGISVSARALAEIVIPRFYGMSVGEWTDEERAVGPGVSRINEGPAALQPDDDEEHYHEDLGRAWLLLTDTPYVSHVCVAAQSLLTQNPAAIGRAVRELDELLAAGRAHAREFRRNLSKDYDIDRDILADVLATQTFQLDDQALGGLAALYRFSGLDAAVAKLPTMTIQL